MQYGEVVAGLFLGRPNRFIAHVRLEHGAEGQVEICHVKNTGRCLELLKPGVTVYLEKSKNPHRKTAYDLIAVEKGKRLINMDSQAPNAVAKEYLPRLLPGLSQLRSEFTFGSSRLDFACRREPPEGPPEEWLVEVKGVTLEEQNKAYFPDAPTLRGVKHLGELIRAKKEGYQALLLFVVQMEGVQSVSPNWATHAAFGEALQAAARAGVRLAAVDCLVTPQSLCPGNPVPVEL